MNFRKKGKTWKIQRGLTSKESAHLNIKMAWESHHPAREASKSLKLHRVKFPRCWNHHVFEECLWESSYTSRSNQVYVSVEAKKCHLGKHCYLHWRECSSGIRSWYDITLLFVYSYEYSSIPFYDALSLKHALSFFIIIFKLVYICDFSGGSDSKSICLQCGRPGFDPWVGKIPWRKKWQPTPVLLPGKSHVWRSLVCYSPWGRK